jgi:hypothetical protein
MVSIVSRYGGICMDNMKSMEEGAYIASIEGG